MVRLSAIGVDVDRASEVVAAAMHPTGRVAKRKYRAAMVRFYEAWEELLELEQRHPSLQKEWEARALPAGLRSEPFRREMKGIVGVLKARQKRTHKFPAEHAQIASAIYKLDGKDFLWLGRRLTDAEWADLLVLGALRVSYDNLSTGEARKRIANAVRKARNEWTKKQGYLAS